MSDSHVNRRDFVRLSAAGTAAFLLHDPTRSPTPDAAQAPPMPERPLGRTGHSVRLLSLGGQATLEQPGKLNESVEIVNRAIDLGVNYIDTAAYYGQGQSQNYIGHVMEDRRDEVFLATKTHDRTRDGSLRHLEQSLRLLRTDHIDLWQLHNIMNTQQIDRIFGRDGAIEALVRAREEGVVRFLGITGHFDPEPLIEGLRRFDFDAVLMALNAADPHVASFGDTVLPLAVERGIGVIGMKIPARGRIFREDGVTTMSQAMSYVLSLPVSTVIVGCDTVEQLEQNVAIARNFRPLSAAQMAQLEQMTALYAPEALFFRKGGAGWRA
jgi:aryl-alcohol dehydrogenase-like predicted oxidoreductase